MIFNLTDDLADSILHSMEDQTCRWMVDAENNSLVPEQNCIDEEKFYSLPEWTSSDGFELLESFTNKLHSPLARTELKDVLVSGRGVFRNFKNVLKAYPEVERKFHFYKDDVMKKRLTEWYNSLRESWGLEKLESVSDMEEMDELVQNDFVFREYDSNLDWNDITLAEGLLLEEIKKQYYGEIGDAFAELWKIFSSYDEPFSKHGFVCRTQTEEFTGCILTSLCPKNAKKTVCITDFFVLQNYRGLGIGRELFSACLESLKKNGIQWVLIANTIIPESMEPLLIQLGFKKLGSGFMADLCTEV